MIRQVLTTLSLLLALCFPVSGTSAEQETDTGKVVRDSACNTPLNIYGVKKDELDAAFEHIRKCVTPDEKLVVFVSGVGGDVNDALSFYDRMHISGLSKQVRFISDGYIASSSNIIWLSSYERVATPMTMFVVHEISVRFPEETPQFEVNFKNILIELTSRAVRKTTNEKAAQLWATAAKEKVSAHTFDAEEALRIGWATELLKYE